MTDTSQFAPLSKLRASARPSVSESPALQVEYTLPEAFGGGGLNGRIGEVLCLRHDGNLSCIACGRSVPKHYGQGFCFPCLRNAPEASECILRPELCRAHLGEGRDPEWERAHHDQPHVVYLSRTSAFIAKDGSPGGIKVGITRQTQVPVRWIDQGAVAALVIARVPHRQLAGAIEVDLKRILADRTNWRAMLCAVPPDGSTLLEARHGVLAAIDPALVQWLTADEEPVLLEFPVAQYPAKVRSVRLEREPTVEGRLVGIKGQYLIWEDGRVLNVRNHAGYHVAW